MEQEKSKTEAVDITRVFRNLSSSETKYDFAKRIKQNKTQISRESAEEIVNFLVTMPAQTNAESIEDCAYFCEKYSLSRDLIKLYEQNNRYDLVARAYEARTDSDFAQEKAQEAYAKHIRIKTKAYILQAINEPNPTAHDIKNFKQLQEIAESKGLVKELTEQVTPYLIPTSILDKLRYKALRKNPEVLGCWQNFFHKNNINQEERILKEMKERIDNKIQKEKILKMEKKLAGIATDRYINFINIMHSENSLDDYAFKYTKKAIRTAERANDPELVKKIKGRFLSEISKNETYWGRAQLKYKFGLLEEAKQEYMDAIETYEKEGKFEEARRIAVSAGLEDKIASLTTVIKAISTNSPK